MGGILAFPSNHLSSPRTDVSGKMKNVQVPSFFAPFGVKDIRCVRNINHFSAEVSSPAGKSFCSDGDFHINLYPSPIALRLISSLAKSLVKLIGTDGKMGTRGFPPASLENSEVTTTLFIQPIEVGHGHRASPEGTG